MDIPDHNWAGSSDGWFAHRSAHIYPHVSIGSGTIVEEYTILGKPHRSTRTTLLTGESPIDSPSTSIGRDCYIQTGCIIYAGAKLEDEVLCSDRCIIYPDATVGRRTKLHYGAQIHKRVLIGASCRIGGFLCDDTVVGRDSSIYGNTLHHYAEHGHNIIAGAPVIHDRTIVGFGALLIGPLIIGERSYIAAGAIVTESVAPESVVTGVNRVTPRAEWQGRLVTPSHRGDQAI